MFAAAAPPTKFLGAATVDAQSTGLFLDVGSAWMMYVYVKPLRSLRVTLYVFISLALAFIRSALSSFDFFAACRLWAGFTKGIRPRVALGYIPDLLADM